MGGPIITAFCTLLHTFAHSGPHLSSGRLESDQNDQNDQECTCPEGQELPQSTDSWPFAGGCCARRTKVTKVVIIAPSDVRQPGIPGILLLPQQSHSRLIKGHLYRCLSNLHPFLPVTPLSPRRIPLEEERQLWPGFPLWLLLPRLERPLEPRLSSSCHDTRDAGMDDAVVSAWYRVVYLGGSSTG